MSIRFGVDRDIFEADGYGGPKAATQARGLGMADVPSRVQGQSPAGGTGGKAPRSKMNLMF